jgi:hypothetical protein
MLDFNLPDLHQQKNKHMSTHFIKTAKSFLLLLIATIAITLVSCKKEKDDPNITYRTINKSFVNNNAPAVVIDSIDFNGNGVNDFYVVLTRITNDTLVAQFQGMSAAFNMDTTFEISGSYVVNEQSGGNTPLYVPGSDNYDESGVFSYRFAAVKKGIAGKGDRIVSFAYATGPSVIYYGWMRLNISDDYKTFKIIDCAYSILPNTAIGLGAK